MVVGCPWELIGSCPEDEGLKASSSPVPAGSPPLSQTASTCDFVQTMFVNKNYLKNTIAAGAWRMGREGSLILLLRQGFP